MLTLLSLAVALDEWKKQMKAFLIDYNTLEIEETMAKGLWLQNYLFY